ncbi:MAG: polysaccharide export protein [Acidobacteria bacterium]|nr:polysaccharide export protein [Acidobacteriota bacterium]
MPVIKFLATLILTAALFAQAPAVTPGYTLGVDDQVVVRVLDMEEISGKDDKPLPVRIDMRGNIHIPVVGRLHAAGLTVEQLEAEIARRLQPVLNDPQVTVTLAEFRSQPVSVLGSVKSPGVHQIHGRKTLFEVLSLAGGLNPDAGNTINITRQVEAGPLPLPDATLNSTSRFHVGQLSVKAVMDAKNPENNIAIQPNDVITVPKADMIYVIGAVKRAGGFILSEKENVSVLQALSLAEGLDRVAAPKNAKILRQLGATQDRTEVAVNLNLILTGKAKDVPMGANDILFIPTNAAKNAGLRALEAAITIGTGVAIYRR